MRVQRGVLRTVAALVALAVALLVAGCSSDDGAVPGGDGAASGGGAERVVRLVTYDGFALPEAAAEAFEKETGARIEVVASGDAGGMLTKALLAAGAPEGDVIFGIDNTLATRAAEADLLDEFTPRAIDTVQQSARLPGRLGELLTPVDRGDVCINADAGWFAGRGDAVPSTLADLTTARYRDLLVVPSPVTSSPGLAFLIGTVQAFGEDGWQEYWEDLKANGVRVRPSWDDAYNTDYTVSGGDRPLVVSYASSPPAEVVFSEGTRTEPASVVLTDTCVSQVEYAGLLSGAENPESGRKLIEFMLSPTWQQDLPLSNFVFPIVEGTALPEEFRRWAVLPESSRALDPTEIGRQRDEWIEQWRSIME